MSATEKRKALRGGAKPEDAFPEPPPEPPAPEAEEPPVRIDGETIVIRLTKPLQPHKGKGEDPLGDLTEVRLRKLYAGDMMALDGEAGTIGQIIALAKQLSSLPEIAIRRLHADDFARVHGIVQGYLGKFLGTSQRLSALSLG